MFEVVHHGLQPPLLLAELLLELLHDLYLHLGLRRALVVQDMTSGKMLEKLLSCLTVSVAPGPLTNTVAVQRVALAASVHRALFISDVSLKK